MAKVCLILLLLGHKAGFHKNLRLTKLRIRDGGRLEFSLFSTRLERTSLVFADIADRTFLLPSLGVNVLPGNLAEVQLGVAAFSSSKREA